MLTAMALAAVWMTRDPALSSVPGKPKTSVAAAPQPVAPASQKLATCPLQPAVVMASEQDGQFPLQAEVAGLIAADIATFIVLGKEAAAAGRPRDAEVAFLMSCRVAHKLKGPDSVESADAKYQLGSHYARLALGGGLAAGADRAELLSRAEILYADSLHTYATRYGEADEKSRFAAQGLASVRQTVAQAQKVQPVPEPPPAPAPAHLPAPDLASGTKGPEKPPQPAPPGAGIALTVSPEPATDATVKIRPDSSAVKKCLPAVATLGLCNSDQQQEKKEQ